MRHLLHWILPLAAILSSSLPAAAAPQILLAIGSKDAVPMRCEGGLCEAELATICLQPYRSDPVRGAFPARPAPAPMAPLAGAPPFGQTVAT